VNKGVVRLGTLIHRGETFDVFARVVEASSKNESLVAEFLAVGKGKLVGGGVKSSDARASLDL